MDAHQLAANGPAVVIASSADCQELSSALEQILAGESTFPYYTIVYGGESSIRLFLQQPFEDAIELDRGSSRPLEIAEELMYFANNGGRYPENTDPSLSKGWIIRAQTFGSKQAAVAQAAWV